MNHNKIRKKFIRLFSIYFIYIVSLSVLNSSLGLINGNSINGINDSVSSLKSSQKTPSEEIKFQSNGNDHTSITSIISNGNDFTATDRLNMSHYFTSNYSTIQDISFDITPPAGYTENELKYNITNIETTVDNYSIVSIVNQIKNEMTNDANFAIAQRFTVTWDFAMFYGASMTLEVDRDVSGLGDYQLELFLVKENASGLPDINSTTGLLEDISYDLMHPYTESNYAPLNDTEHFYDFADVKLTSGNYFIVANLSVIDYANPSIFYWKGGNGVTSSYYRDISDGLWHAPINYIFSLNVQMMHSDVSGTPIVFDNPASVNLDDGGTPITSTTQTIISAGTHTLTANTSVSISFNNSYSFTTDYNVNSQITIFNSTLGDYSNNWNLSWTTPSIDHSPYTNLIRTQFVFSIPNDWNDTYYFFINGLSSSAISKTGNEYSINLLDAISAMNLSIITFSPNYLNTTTLSDDISETNKFVLGTWYYNESFNIGSEGSTIYAEAEIQDILISGGTFNFTLFNREGLIIQRKNYTDLLSINLDYNDTSDYSGLGYLDGLVYKHSLTIDPSVYGTDVEGSWTAAVFWQNGTEIGFFSKTIEVQKPTLAEFLWEETYNQDDLIDLPSIKPLRINGHEIAVVVGYYNISDPYFSGIGSTIPNANISYSTNWGGYGEFRSNYFNGSHYLFDIITDAPVGEYNISITTSGPFLESHTIQFTVKIIHQFELSPVRTSYEVNYTNPVTVVFELRDISYGNILLKPDNIILTFNGSTLDSSYYDYVFVNQRIKITIDTGDILETVLSPDSYVILITATKADFVSDYGMDTAVDSTTIVVTPILTQIVIEDSVTTTDINSQITISFRFVDMNNSVDITGATLEVRFDIEEVELVTQSEVNGLYTLIIRINNPTTATLNIFITISKLGFQTQLDILLTSVSIRLPDGEGIPLGVLIGIIAGIVVAILGVVGYFIIRGRIVTIKETRMQAKSKTRSIFQSAMMIKKILVVHHETSLPVFEKDIDMASGIDPSIVTGVLQAISTIGMEMIGAATGIKKIEYYGFVITSAYSGNYTVYVFSETELEKEFEEGVSNIARWFDLIFGYDSAQWDGSMDIYNEYKASIEEKISEELYLWLLNPLSVGEETVTRLESLSGIEQEIVSFINKKGKTSLLLVLDKLDNFEDDELLEAIFRLVNSNLVITSNLD